MRRLNVQFSQIEECVSTALFALDALPRNPPLQKGELLLLQLTKDDAGRLGKLNQRVEFALVFDHVEEDPTGVVSRRHWPQAEKTWRYILHCSGTVTAIPFSLENLSLSQSYAGQGNAIYIERVDEARIAPHLQGGVHPAELIKVAGVRPLLRAIKNYDAIQRWSTPRVSVVRDHIRTPSDAWLPNALKAFYDHKCQICVHDFRPRWGEPYADTRYLNGPTAVGQSLSSNMVVVCPNHNAIIGAARATYDEDELAFRFPNGLVEKLTLREHLLA